MGELAGVYRGSIANVDDPAGAGRVQLEIPALLGGELSAWAEPAFVGPIPPGVGEACWVAFEAGDITRPVYFPPVVG